MRRIRRRTGFTANCSPCQSSAVISPSTSTESTLGKARWFARLSQSRETRKEKEKSSASRWAASWGEGRSFFLLWSSMRSAQLVRSGTRRAGRDVHFTHSAPFTHSVVKRLRSSSCALVQPLRSVPGFGLVCPFAAFAHGRQRPVNRDLQSYYVAPGGSPERKLSLPYARVTLGLR